MDLPALAEAVRDAADREQHFVDAIARKADWPPGGLFLPRAALIPHLHLAAAVLGALGGRRELVAAGDMVHFRCRALEHYGDAVLAEFPSVRGSATAVFAASCMSQVEPRR